jgi:hypothetical protein
MKQVVSLTFNLFSYSLRLIKLQDKRIQTRMHIDMRALFESCISFFVLPSLASFFGPLQDRGWNLKEACDGRGEYAALLFASTARNLGDSVEHLRVVGPILLRPILL